MTDNNKQEKEPIAKNLKKGDQDFLKEVYLLFAQAIKKDINIFFDNAEDELNKEFSQSSHVNSQQLVSQIKSVKVHKLNVLSSFINSIKNTFLMYQKSQFNYFEDKITKVLSKKEGYDSLIDKDDIVEKQKQNALIFKYEKICVRQILTLKQKFSKISEISIDSQKLPFGPFVVVSAFAKSLRLLHLDIHLKTKLYQLFDEKVLENLPLYYAEITQLFSKGPSITSAGLSAKTGQKSPENSLEEAEILNMLEKVQNNLALSDAFQVKEKLFKTLKNKFNEKELSLEHKNILDLVTILFQIFQNDSTIPNKIKSIVNRLQVPYFKAAILNKKLLENEDHPARTFIGALTHASQFWTPENDEDRIFIQHYKAYNDAFLKEKEFVDDFFIEQHKHLKVFIQDHKDQFFSQESKVNDKVQGRNKIVTAMKTVEALLTHKMSSYNTPEFIKNLLLGPWKNLLVLLLVRHSNSSNMYLDKINFIDDLYSVLAKEDYGFILKEKLEMLSKRYREGLKLIAYSEIEIDIKSHELSVQINDYHKQLNQINGEETHEKLDSDIALTKPHSKLELENKAESLPTKNSKKAVKDTVYDGLTPFDKQMVKSIKYGMWLDFMHKNGNKVRAKLSWINPKTNKFLFVNDRGLKITDKTAQELADDLKNKTILIVKSK